MGSYDGYEEEWAERALKKARCIMPGEDEGFVRDLFDKALDYYHGRPEMWEQLCASRKDFVGRIITKMVSLYRDELRRRRRELPLDSLTQSEYGEGPGQSLEFLLPPCGGEREVERTWERHAAQCKVRELVKDALLSLPKLDRRIVYRIALKGHKAADVARDLGMTDGSVYKRYRRALKKARQQRSGRREEVKDALSELEQWSR